MPTADGHARFAMPEETRSLYSGDFEHPDSNQCNADGQLQLETELIADQPDAEPLPDFVQDMFEVAGIPRSMGAGESLSWTNACKTSTKFQSAHAQVNADATWFELTVMYQTGRNQRLRCNRYGDMLVLEDSAGIEPNGMLQNSVAAALLDFANATKQLMVRH